MLDFDRYFSDPDVHPYDEKEWELHSPEITNQEGEVIWSQDDVEFPEDWSDESVRIVASKYFWGDNDLPEDVSVEEGGREDSLKQLIDRVAGAICDWGEEDGYFDKETREVFEDELKWLLVNQHAAFNSPVWFNVGLHWAYGITEGDKQLWSWDDEEGEAPPADGYKSPQASACFIVGIEDTIEDIYNLVQKSARLFKFGSGIGSDWSNLRSTKDKLSGGGKPSGPVSFMRVQDKTGGVIKSGGKTRRAAIMQTLRSWHPDVEEFVSVKLEEEKKAQTLIDGGYPQSFNGPAYGTVDFQNVNQSLRATDKFMEAAKNGEEYELVSPHTGDIKDTVQARDILEKVAEGTYYCGDPGMQFEDRMQEWHTCPNDGKINSTNPCSEYVWLDDTACNLASLNLMKFKDGPNGFDAEKFLRAVRIIFTAQEILVDRAGYPAKDIAEESHKYRTIGLGYANVGALLMSMGLPYDSGEGRRIIAAITSMMNGEAYAQSARIAKEMGTFERFEANEDPMMEVMEKHDQATVKLTKEAQKEDGGHALSTRLAEEAMNVNEHMLSLGQVHGYRNAQATVIAPTGTISFYMGCDTTGIEPCLALVSYKQLAGERDSMIKRVSTTVPQALDVLGYSAEEINEITDYVREEETIEGAPHLQDEHLPVFDCSFEPRSGERSIHHMGHVRMMAAVQPFVSGSISKTVNMPEESSVEDIMDTYQKSWELGVKAIAIYRENSKQSQPLSTSMEDEESAPDLDTEEIVEEYFEEVEAFHGSFRVYKEDVDKVEQMVQDITQEFQQVSQRPVRTKLPDTRQSVTHKFNVAGTEGYVTVGLYENGQPGELFINVSKQGSTFGGIIDAFAISTSVALQYGAPLEDLCRKFKNMRFEPSGFTGRDEIQSAKSIIDYIFRWLEKEFILEDGSEDAQQELSPEEDQALKEGLKAIRGELNGSEEPSGNGQKMPPQQMKQEQAEVPVNGSGELCPDCGGVMKVNGSCHVCTQCGSTTGCG